MDADRLRELNDRLLTCGNDCSDVLLDGAAEIERLRARVAELRGLLKELRIRLHVTGRRPEECYEMSLIDAALLYCEARSDIRERHMSSKEAEAAWDSAEYNAKRAESAEARVTELEEALAGIAIYGCGMLSMPPAANMPERDWFRARIAEYERVAYAALAGKEAGE